MSEHLQLTGGAGKSKRRELDFYPTPKEVTIALMEFLKLPICTIWEPACGNGAMSKVLQQYGHKVISSDIAEKSFGECNRDFLQTDFVIACDAIITNPPFNLSHLFIKKALTIAETVAMVCKSQYWHSRNRTKLFISHPPAYVLPLTWRADFMNDQGGGSPVLEALWTVWIKGNTQCRYWPLLKPGNKMQTTLFE